MSSPSQAPRSAELVRGLGTTDTVLLTVGSVIGTGIFLTSSDIARVLPDPRLLLSVWLVGGLLSLTGALTYAELGALYPRAGGIYHYLKEAYSPLFGFLYGWGAFLIIMSGGMAALAVGFGEYLGSFLPWFSTAHILVSAGGWSLSGGQVAAALAILVLTVINYFGLRSGALAQNLLTVLKIGSIVLFVVLGLLVEGRAPLELTPSSAAPSGLLAAFGVAMIAALWTYDGWYGPTFSAGEMRDPERSLPRGLLFGTLLITLLYLLLNLVYLRALPIEGIAQSPRIGEDAAALLFGALGGRLAALVILISTFGCLAATILYSSRIYAPMADDGLFFRSLGHLHPRYRIPDKSLWAQSLWAMLLTLSGSYQQLYTYVVFAVVLFQVATAGALFVLRRTRPDLPRPYRVWGYPFVPALFLAASLLLALNTLFERPLESLAGLGLLAAGLPAYAFWRRRAASQRS